LRGAWGARRPRLWRRRLISPPAGWQRV